MLAFGGLVALVAALGERRWWWAAGIFLSGLLLAVPFSLVFRAKAPWLCKMVVGGFLIVLVSTAVLLAGLQSGYTLLPQPAG
ncbi:hypothetical protein GCM10011289_07850 [Paludibacterium paludis]|uniref:Uncharacterized protein n=2 Tax=Paludibacterium paludis TaxID=1225769 RepID=A0A918U866_9NEIS|nr:hypothetical protein GCM10011289_07850 [Paludibacterium paludis]